MSKKKDSKIAIIALVVALILILAVVIGRAACTSRSNVEAAGQTAKNGYANLEYTLIGSSIPSKDLEYEGFRVSFNPQTHVPNWVGWELLGSETTGDISRSNNFWQDMDVEGCASLEDYRRSGYDRGHMCPAADQKWSQKAMEDCFVLTNMAPQDGALNRGAWQTLEDKTRQWAQRDSALIVVAGPIYNPGEKRFIGDGVRVPDAFFKVLLAPYVEHPRAIGFVYPNMSSPGNMQNYVMTVDEIETLTGYDFFSSLPDEIENEVEAVASFKEWNRRK